MKSTLEKCVRLSESASDKDRLSEMPDEVLLHILSLMPTVDAVRTMLLRRFGDLWTFIPALRFDFDDYRYGLSWNDHFEPPCYSVAFPSFVNFIRNVLMLHRRPTIDAFHFSNYDSKIHLDDPMISADVQMWLRFATARNVKELFLRYYRLGELVVPRCVLKSQVLATLNLSHCVLDPHHQTHMGALKKLSLDDVKGNNEAVRRLISGCPSLQELVIENIDADREMQNLNISSRSVSKLYLNLGYSHDSCSLDFPNLKVLDIAVCSPLFQLDVINVPSLQEVTVMDLPSSYPPSLVLAFCRKFQNAVVLTLCDEAFEELAFIKQLDFPRNNWKRLVLQPFWYFERNLQVIFELVKSSVILEELIIHAGNSHVNCELLSSDYSTCVLPLLRTVSIYAYGKLCEGLIQLVELLLRSAVVLEKLVVTFGKDEVTAVEQLNFVKQVSGFRRGSANAIVDFICLDNILRCLSFCGANTVDGHPPWIRQRVETST